MTLDSSRLTGPLQAADETSRLYRILARANQIASTTELDDLLCEMLDLILMVSGSNTGTMYLFDTHTNELVFQVVRGAGAGGKLVGQRIGASEGIIGAAVQQSEAIVVNDLAADARWYGPVDDGDTLLTNTIAFPLMLRGEPVGAVQVFNFSQKPIQLMQLLGNRMASEYEKDKLLRNTQQHSQRLQALIELIAKISSTLDRDQILQVIIAQARDLLNAEASSLFLLDDQQHELILNLSRDMHQTNLPPLRMPAELGIIGDVVRTGIVACVDDVKADARHYPGIDEISGMTTKSLLAVPLRVPTVVLGRERGATQSCIIGGVEAINKRDGHFDANDVQLLGTLAEQAASVLHIANLYNDADELFLNTITALVASIDAKDPYTEGHSQRVSDFSVAIAEQLNLPPEMRHSIRIGALLHDIGKIGVPDTILTKPGRLTVEEYDEIKKHPAIGANIIRGVSLLSDELPALAQHHERLDGKGYPLGLSGDQISPIARIVAVADVFDAITSDRPYRPGIDIETALDILRSITGEHLDEKYVDALITAYMQDKIKPQPRY
ncbi:MAG: GAF domain-containing protein [Chloroflexi bacterium]|jgi:putative nucleotidyltransferase with HDIG domain|nr:GAF domain-containing protein [Chloroflexota bacterium]